MLHEEGGRCTVSTGSVVREGKVLSEGTGVPGTEVPGTKGKARRTWIAQGRGVPHVEKEAVKQWSTPSQEDSVAMALLAWPEKEKDILGPLKAST